MLGVGDVVADRVDGGRVVGPEGDDAVRVLGLQVAEVLLCGGAVRPGGKSVLGYEDGLVAVGGVDDRRVEGEVCGR